MINTEQLLLTKLAEECAEVAQTALKCQQFGLDDVYNGSTNLERLQDELNDLLSILGLLSKYTEFKFELDLTKAANKMDKVKHYAEYSAKLGKVDKDVFK